MGLLDKCKILVCLVSVNRESWSASFVPIYWINHLIFWRTSTSKTTRVVTEPILSTQSMHIAHLYYSLPCDDPYPC
uniref:Uncharacterized protein n=1 Tax=Arundo donax TaxID=35708 RepID=A0A0A9DL88_ARUDO